MDSMPELLLDCGTSGASAMRKWKPPKYIDTYAYVSGRERDIRAYVDVSFDEPDVNAHGGLEVTAAMIVGNVRTVDVLECVDNIKELEQRLWLEVNEMAKAYYEDER
jgi:hypothetical protein